MNIFDILSNDERIIVYSDKSIGMLVTWNQSLTFQTFVLIGKVYEETDIHVTMETPRGYKAAREIAMRWVNGEENPGAIKKSKVKA